MKYLAQIAFVAIAIILCGQSAFGQSDSLHEIKGTIKDAASSETLIGASVLYAPGKGTQTDIDGNYSLKLPDGEYTLTFSYVGYLSETKKIKVNGKNIAVDFKLNNTTLNEVEVVADVAKIRETPVAVSSISSKQIQEELGAQDMTMLLNTTPGVYATQQGGGSGDSRINIRGFDQRYVAVLVDGVPVNDMENGQVFWSNWSGLSEITNKVQVQRGLGASRLAVPSVGGTMNIITSSIDTKQMTTVKHEFGSNNYDKISLAYNSGLIKNKFAFTVAGSYAKSDGWVDQTFNKTWAYFAKFQWRINSRNLITVGANGAPQSHGQRTPQIRATIYDANFAKNLGINTDSVLKSSNGYATTNTGSRGLTYNPAWGFVNGKALNTRMNYFHKPLFNISHFLTVNEKTSVSNVLYASFGTGGGTLMQGTPAIDYKGSGQLLLQDVYNKNVSNAAISPFFDPTQHQTSSFIATQVNNHQWYGFLSTVNYQVNKAVHFTGGVDGRYYMGTHYETPYNLLGADYVTDQSDPTATPVYLNPKSHMFRTGDKIIYYNDSRVSWLGLFGQAEYKNEKLSAFITVTGNQSGFQNKNYFAKKDVVIGDNIYRQALKWGDTLYYDGTHAAVHQYNDPIKVQGDGSLQFKDQITGQQATIGSGYTKYDLSSKETRTNLSVRKLFYGYTVKGGANYNLNENQNVFFNAGYMSIVPKYNNVFDRNGREVSNVNNTSITSFELGYGARNSIVAVNVNGYYTIWNNKPLDFPLSYIDKDGNILYVNINDMNALHKGLEADLVYTPFRKVQVGVFASLADWRYTSGGTAYVTGESGALLDSIKFSAKGVHVGNAAQTQVGGNIRWEFIKNMYVKAAITYFGRNYAQFDPIGLQLTKADDYRDRESWKMPDYYFVDFFMGYKIKSNNIEYTITAGINNLLDAVYITDASFPLGTTPKYYNATNATVYMSQGRRYNIGFRVNF